MAPIRYSKLLKPFTFVSDLVMLNLAITISSYFVFRYYSSEIQMDNFFLLANLTWITISSLTKNYYIDRPLVLRQNLSSFFTSVAYHLMLVLSIIYFFKFFDISRTQIIFTYLVFVPLMVVERSLIFAVLDSIRMRGFNNKQILIIGTPDATVKLKNTFYNHPEYGYEINQALFEDISNDIDLPRLFERIINGKIREVFVCYKALEPSFVEQIVDFGDHHNVAIKFVSDLALENNTAKVINYGNLPVIQLSHNPEMSFKVKAFKRSFDVLFSLFVMIPGCPVFIMLAIVTKFTSKGPVFYSQERIGKNGKPFKIYKFRSMRVNAEAAGPQLSKDNDPRITKWGRVIRKSRLDELPQFWNVLKGDMSVVGPRPERQYFIDQLIQRSPNYKKLMKLKPGLTSMGQVNYGYAENLDQMCDRVDHDLVYLNNMNFNNEMSVILKTIKVMAQLKGK